MTDETQGTVGIVLSSPEFSHQANMPVKFTCEGDNINPQLTIERVPNGAKSLALIVDDPDAPAKVWLHWLIFNIPPAATVINENSVPEGAVLGTSDFGKTAWGGPCPPSGKHRYFFRLYALDTELDLDEGASREQVEQAMAGHTLEQTELIGLYEKQNK